MLHLKSSLFLSLPRINTLSFKERAGVRMGFL